MKDLSQCRQEIDEIDSELLNLLERRMRVAENVARYKLENSMKVFDETRERAVLDKIGERSPEDIRMNLVGTKIFSFNYKLSEKFSDIEIK